jgi:hypothetical protein
VEVRDPIVKYENGQGNILTVCDIGLGLASSRNLPSLTSILAILANNVLPRQNVPQR